jgi:hypothetical protein
MQNTIEHLGAYSFLFTQSSELLFLFLPKEDLGKSEAVPNTAVCELHALSPAMLGVISGGVDPGEESDLRRTIVREAAEERGWSPSVAQVTNGYPRVTVLQQRPKNGTLTQVRIAGVGHRIILNEQEEQYLVANHPHQIIAPAALFDVLEREGKTLFRPFVYVALLKAVEEQLHIVSV